MKPISVHHGKHSTSNSVTALISWVTGVNWRYRKYLPSVLWHCWLGDRKGIRPVKKLGTDLFVVTFWLQLCTSYSSSCHHSPPPSSLAPTKSKMETFRYRLTQVHLENGRRQTEHTWLSVTPGARNWDSFSSSQMSLRVPSPLGRRAAQSWTVTHHTGNEWLVSRWYKI